MCIAFAVIMPDEDAAPQPTSETEHILAGIARMESTLDRLRQQLNELKAIVSPNVNALDWWDRRCHVLVDVYQHDGVVTADEWYSIGEKYGYDRRGLGGFFAGNSPSMTQIAGGRHALTEAGRRDAEEYVEIHPELRR